MSEIKITIHSDWSEIFDELDRIDGMPNDVMTARLDAVLEMAFLETKAITHVITGSLKNSGREDSDSNGHKWEGTITYGGPSPGFPHDPVRYAGYEQDRGGTHDMLHPAYLYYEAFREAVREGLEE